MAAESEIRILDSAEAVFLSAASEFAALASAAVRRNGRFCVALSGGSTPKSLYALLASGAIPDIPWNKIFFFWGDERHVPPDHADSNYLMAKEGLLSKVPEEHVFRIHAEEKDADTAAQAYEQTITAFFGLQPGEFPRFDLMLLGMGPDGHTASLFPGTSALNQKHRLVVANWVDKFKAYRITLTLPVINQSAGVMFLVCGQDKASALHEVLENHGEELPAKRVRPLDGRLLWLVDRSAARALSVQTTNRARPARL